MKRHYLMTQDLDALSSLKHTLNDAGLHDARLHLLSNKDAEIQSHHLQTIESLMQRDLVRASFRGALIGLCIAVYGLTTVWLLRWHTSPLGWTPFVFVALSFIGFCIWEGGLIGVQRPNSQYRRFRHQLKQGQHILMIDSLPTEENKLDHILGFYPELHYLGCGVNHGDWLMRGEQQLHKLLSPG